MTPPSAEAITPTKDEDKTIQNRVINESAESTLLVEAKENVQAADDTTAVDIPEQIVPASRPDYNPNPHSRTPTPADSVHAQSQLRGRLDPVAAAPLCDRVILTSHFTTCIYIIKQKSEGIDEED
ncbi:hypothetical protein ACJJTC_003476 [Scirpophaga incertulas]